MKDRRPERKPVQMSLFSQPTVSVSWVAKHLNKGRDLVVRLLESGMIKGYRMTPKGWWNVIKESVFEYEEQLRKECGLEPDERGK